MKKEKLGEDKYDALQREIVETENKLKELEKEASVASSSLTKISDTGAKLKTVGKGIESAGKKMLDLSAGVLAVGGASAKWV
ncbi:hypothetical protein KQ878_03380 [Mycoplasma zalophidermidis]|uniref:Uncharacterized protein n=1 Tax=Mycoplasma zalophidermidis TaxID=398174 RepID=A0ABS6DSB5_9MOLU|nr:hypothetical protein [Mycoplasma zalophidermidis]MBU4693909.1 hypothetical protein [Mycoplasma zalophidermidis]